MGGMAAVMFYVAVAWAKAHCHPVGALLPDSRWGWYEDAAGHFEYYRRDPIVFARNILICDDHKLHVLPQPDPYVRPERCPAGQRWYNGSKVCA